ncbi:MAG: hypothetical protein II388_07830, partial [Clostridia bacterium]|nr:hypothetical protein [Clostridia bacterium]
QAETIEAIMPYLTEEEEAVYKRGKNAHTTTVPKNARNIDYHRATGLEALFGYVYLKGDIERLRELFCLAEKMTGERS